MSIPLLDLKIQYEQIKDEINPAVLEVMKSGYFILGPNVAAFEKEMASYLGVDYAVGLASGTDALIIALRSLGIGAGDQVIIPAYSFFSTVGAILLVGAEPIFVDIIPKTFLIDTEQIKNSINSKTKAMIPVHLYGQAANMDEILLIAKENGIKVIEDNAQAIGATYKGKKTGAIGDIGCLSFFPSKNLGAYGDGGMLVTNDEETAVMARKLRSHGWQKKYHPESLGLNSRLDEIQAAVLRIKLNYLDIWNKQRREIAKKYTLFFNEIGLSAPFEESDRMHTYHLYVLTLENRDFLKNELNDLGISSGIYYPIPLHLTQPCLKFGGKLGQFPISEKASRELLAIPIFPGMKNEQIEEVCFSIKQIMFG